MKTAVLMKRTLFNGSIAQNSKTGMFSATDLVKAGNMFRLANGLPMFDPKTWLRTKSTKEFMSELEIKYGQIKINSRGKGQHTWIHPLLFIDMALAISPKLKIEVYEWLFDHLIKERNNSGDSYKTMCGCLYVRHGNKREFPKYIQKVAKQIRNCCRVDDWQEASEDQLALRSRLHYDIALLSDAMNNNNEAVRIALSRKRK